MGTSIVKMFGKGPCRHACCVAKRSPLFARYRLLPTRNDTCSCAGDACICMLGKPTDQLACIRVHQHLRGHLRRKGESRLLKLPVLESISTCVVMHHEERLLPSTVKQRACSLLGSCTTHSKASTAV